MKKLLIASLIGIGVLLANSSFAASDFLNVIPGSTKNLVLAWDHSFVQTILTLFIGMSGEDSVEQMQQLFSYLDTSKPIFGTLYLDKMDMNIEEIEDELKKSIILGFPIKGNKKSNLLSFLEEMTETPIEKSGDLMVLSENAYIIWSGNYLLVSPQPEVLNSFMSAKSLSKDNSASAKRLKKFLNNSTKDTFSVFLDINMIGEFIEEFSEKLDPSIEQYNFLSDLETAGIHIVGNINFMDKENSGELALIVDLGLKSGNKLKNVILKDNTPIDSFLYLPGSPTIIVEVSLNPYAINDLLTYSGFLNELPEFFSYLISEFKGKFALAFYYPKQDVYDDVGEILTVFEAVSSSKATEIQNAIVQLIMEERGESPESISINGKSVIYVDNENLYIYTEGKDLILTSEEWIIKGLIANKSKKKTSEYNSAIIPSKQGYSILKLSLSGELLSELEEKAKGMIDFDKMDLYMSADKNLDKLTIKAVLK